MTARPFAVRYEDEDLLVLSKPAGLVVHPVAGRPQPTLVDALLAYLPTQAAFDSERAGLVHRLDQGTSGLLIVAKTLEAKNLLAKQFANRTIGKRYQAVVHGVPKHRRGNITAPLRRHHADPTLMAVRPDGKIARTSYHVVGAVRPYALLDVVIATGRTHQIRVHLAALGHPIVGDTTYGRGRGTLEKPVRLLLHAVELRFHHPRTGQTVTVTDELPKDFLAFCQAHGLL